MDNNKSTRNNRKNKEKSKTFKYFGSQKHIRIKLDLLEKKLKNNIIKKE
jgi:hypothetical protein